MTPPPPAPEKALQASPPRSWHSTLPPPAPVSTAHLVSSDFKFRFRATLAGLSSAVLMVIEARVAKVTRIFQNRSPPPSGERWEQVSEGRKRSIFLLPSLEHQCRGNSRVRPFSVHRCAALPKP